MLEIILNRLRGTGDIFSISKLNVTGTILYALFYFVLFSVLTTNVYCGILGLIGFLIGESFGWGKWVGSLCYPERYSDKSALNNVYLDAEGYKFPWIHYIANLFVKEKDNFLGYCRVALALRGMYWAMFLYLGLLILGYIPYYLYALVLLIYAIGFPLACFLSTRIIFNIEHKFINIRGSWETQEVFYGLIHGLCNLLIIYFIVR